MTTPDEAKALAATLRDRSNRVFKHGMPSTCDCMNAAADLLDAQAAALTAAQARIAELEAKVEAAVCRCLDEENSGGAVRTVTRDCPLHASCPEGER